VHCTLKSLLQSGVLRSPRFHKSRDVWLSLPWFLQEPLRKFFSLEPVKRVFCIRKQNVKVILRAGTNLAADPAAAALDHWALVEPGDLFYHVRHMRRRAHRLADYVAYSGPRGTRHLSTGDHAARVRGQAPSQGGVRPLSEVVPILSCRCNAHPSSACRQY